MRLKEFLDIQEELGGLGHPSSGGTHTPKQGAINPNFFAAWKKQMKEKGAVKFEKVELDNIMAYDKDGKGVGAYDAWSNTGVEMNEAASPDDDDYDGKDGEYINAFFVAGWNEEASKSWIGKVSKSEGKWVETSAEGAEPDNWGGKRYMSYLTPDDVMGWLSKDYDEVDGPFFDKEEAIEHAEHKFGPLGN